MGKSTSVVLYEDNHLIAVNKRAGELSQGDNTGDDEVGDWVKAYIKEKYNKPGDVFLGVPHRLDRPVSGVMLLARTSKALTRVTEMFRKREIEKIYWAIVARKRITEKGTLKHYLSRLEGKNITKALNKPEGDAQEAVLDYEIKKEWGKYMLLEVRPHTGRQHQIRVQLAKIGCPIVGDVKYGYPDANVDASICLHARELRLTHPVQKTPLRIVAQVPDLPIWRDFK